jgi:Flp pilus assembly protein TadB
VRDVIAVATAYAAVLAVIAAVAWIVQQHWIAIGVLVLLTFPRLLDFDRRRRRRKYQQRYRANPS